MKDAKNKDAGSSKRFVATVNDTSYGKQNASAKKSMDELKKKMNKHK